MICSAGSMSASAPFQSKDSSSVDQPIEEARGTPDFERNNRIWPQNTANQRGASKATAKVMQCMVYAVAASSSLCPKPVCRQSDLITMNHSVFEHGSGTACGG
jgi:hypothetical protein